MRFGANGYLHLLGVAVIVLVAFFIWEHRSRRALLERFAESTLLVTLLAGVDEGRRHVKAAVVGVALVLILFALARPEWGFHWQEVKRKGLDIIVAIDTSRSMLAIDVKPNRIERAKLAVKDMLQKIEGDRIGLIAFSGTAFLQCPLTVDYNGFRIALDDLSTETIPRGGTNMGQAIQEALRAFKSGVKKYQALVIITDGENLEGDAAAWAEEAKKQGVKIFCVGIGTKEGELIPLTDAEGRKSFLKDRTGAVVKTHLDEEMLQRIALATGGSYVRATGASFGLDVLYDQKLATMEKRELESKMSKQYEERFQWFLFVALILLLVEPCISERKYV